MFGDNIETYWAAASHAIAVLGYIVEGWMFYQFVKPFMRGKQYCVGLIYSITMLLLYCVPQEITYPNLQGALVACITMCLLERRNIKQKVFLATYMYLFRWVVYGVTLVLRDLMFALFINTPYMLAEPVKQWITYIIVELAYYSIALTVMYLVIKLTHKVYVNKKEDISAVAEIYGAAPQEAATADKDKTSYMKGILGKGVVLLSENQIEELLEIMGLDCFDYYVDKLSSFILKTGAKVKNHYATLVKWWEEDRSVVR